VTQVRFGEDGLTVNTQASTIDAAANVQPLDEWLNKNARSA
jgi:hypothetical protein